MSFTLQIQFTGLCLYLAHSKRKNEIAVLLPDARHRKRFKALHHDNTDAVPHVGYLRFDLANLAVGDSEPNVPVGDLPTDMLLDNGPPFEVVYRFHGQTLRLGLPETSDPVNIDAKVPNLDDFASELRLHDSLFTTPTRDLTKNPALVLLRTALQGGSLTTEGTTTEYWSIDRRLFRPNDPPFVEDFHGDVLWTRDIEGSDDTLSLSLTDLDGSNKVLLTLRPKLHDGKNVIRMKIANLCSDNPLEWDELAMRSAGLEDSDFKWIYKLLTPPNGQAWPQFLNGYMLPAPRIIKELGQASGWPRIDCSGGKLTADFPPIAIWP